MLITGIDTFFCKRCVAKLCLKACAPCLLFFQCGICAFLRYLVTIECIVAGFNGWNKEGVIAMGTGVPEFYYAQGMSTGIALTDWSGDMNHYSYELVEEISKTNEELIINVDLLNYEYFNEYEIVDSFDGNNIHLVYLKK